MHAETIRNSFAKQGLMTSIGARLEKVEAGAVSISCPRTAGVTQQHGFIHAGITTSIADSACGYAAYTLMPEGTEVLSVEFKINLLRPANCEQIIAHARVIKPGKTLTVCDAEVVSDTGKLIARMQATMICVANDAGKAAP